MKYIAETSSSVSEDNLDKNLRDKRLMDDGWLFYRGRIEGFILMPQGKTIEKWRWKNVNEVNEKAEEMAALGLDTSGWDETKPGSDVFNGRQGFAWFQAELGELPKGPTGRPRLYFQSVKDNASVYLNGEKLIYHEGGDSPFEVTLDSAWNKGGPNELAVLVHNTRGRGGIDGAVLYNRPAMYQEDIGMRSVKTASVDFDDGDWEEISIPHDFSVEGEFDPKGADKYPRLPGLWYDRDSGYLPKGVGWYRRAFYLPSADKGKRIWLEFDGVYRNSDVWINGHWLGHHWSGYTSFYYDITDMANYGEKNVVTVRADADWDEASIYYEGGGIYRHVWLTKLSPLHVGHWGTFVTTPRVTKKLAEVNIKTMIVNDGLESSTCTLTNIVTDVEGKMVAKSELKRDIPAGQEYEFSQDVMIKDPILWSLDNPYLYTVKTTVKSGNRVADVYETPLGIRYFRFDGREGFFLNGDHVKIRGAMYRQDFAGVGIALPDRIHVHRLEKLKEMGCNGYRCSHNPMSETVLDACDRLGILVVNEKVPQMGDSEEILADLERLLRRDRNHPSVIMWSLWNEGLKQGIEEAQKQGQAMYDLVKRLDPHRPITGGQSLTKLEGAIKVADVIDCRGFNPENYNDYHEKNPNIPMVALETGYALTTRGIYDGNRERGYLSCYSPLASKTWRMVEEHDYVAGGFVCTGFDYRGEPHPFDWPSVTSSYGFHDICGFPKDDYYFYKSSWSNETVLHIFPHWNWAHKKESERMIDIWCYSNCESVELFLNGKSKGQQNMHPNSCLSWNIEWEPGVLEAKGYKDGKIVAETRRETTGDPARITLEPDRSNINADGEDVSLVTVSILDSQGRLVPTAGNEVKFSVDGPGEIIGVGNGNPSSHEPDKAEKRSAFNGLCMVIIQAEKEQGLIKLTATSPGLGISVVEIKSVKAVGRRRAEVITKTKSDNRFMRSEKMAKCQSCGAEVKRNDKFCPRCGIPHTYPLP